MKEEIFYEKLNEILFETYGVDCVEADKKQIYYSVSEYLRRYLSSKYHTFKQKALRSGAKRICYLSMEFLLGKSLKNNLYNLSLMDAFEEYLKKCSYTVDEIFDFERDAGLGNGGLGRLAASYLEAMATNDYWGEGYSILYEHGMFTQTVKDEKQIELPDKWLDTGRVWLNERFDRFYKVKVGGKYDEQSGKYTDYKEIKAVGYDIHVSGFNSDAVSLLKLWKAMPSDNFEMSLQTEGRFDLINEEKHESELLSLFLYPADNTDEGRELRIIQQYFFVSASVQHIIAEHYKRFRSVENLSEHVCFHINDTHPAICIPEILRVLCDDYGMDEDKAYEILLESVSYTNHTVMPEALESWEEKTIKDYFPRIYSLIKSINKRQESNIYRMSPSEWERIADISIINGGRIHMARLAALCSNKINGVSGLHTEIIKNTLFSDYYGICPQKFVNVTNGISYRRWLCSANEKLSGCIDGVIGSEFRDRPYELVNLRQYATDKRFLEDFEESRISNKQRLSNRIKELVGFSVDPQSMFDVQIKRLHEYKRQLLNVLKILSYYCELQNNPNAEISPKTFIFASKAAMTYLHAKRIIELINKTSEMIRNDPKTKDVLSVVFLPDYNVSLAENIIPAADVSEQISLAGKEASGTGNMKFMINGALTIGTYDGANVEISKLAGEENVYIFGMRVDEVDSLYKKGISPSSITRGNERLIGVLSLLRNGIAGEDFSDIADYLTKGESADPYFCLYDYESYMNVYHELCIDFKNKRKFFSKGVFNVAAAGYFSSDRAIEEYADKIWHTEKVR